MQIIINQIKIIDYDISINSKAIIESINDNKICQDFMIFPELSLTGFPTNQNIDALWKESETYFQEILSASRNTQATIIIGHIEKHNQNFYNSCFFIKNSKVIHNHRKSKLWLDDVGIFSSGSHHSIIDINGTNYGAQICFELEFPEGSRALSKQGAEVIFMPNGNMHPYGNVHYVLTQARAIENQCFVITCNRVGSGHGGDFVGESLVVSPTGEIIKKLSSNQEITTITIDLNEIEQSRNNYNYINLL
ncbi:carbon-nitrogen hydrolase family protein [Colwellia psychrerythraea]|uniref:Hydrolase, carbon-nitrogen family n=1 Tax=Colwellia psychrerythraea (strain 34H / ATCC BAA-681) TaxID=167879 RepID=Q483K8_COLP3|nr:carbon-nitrogen hydrolase family protein [Colwellia psychrerythraea]AAZ28497.1 hydrolase, carbon-nitrogen family [Colwellia psychrerythraea 34H]